MTQEIHVEMNKYIGIKENDGCYTIINPQSLEAYRSSLKEIQECNIIIYESEPIFPLYDKYGNKIDYADKDLQSENWPDYDKNGNKIVYLDD